MTKGTAAILGTDAARVASCDVSSRIELQPGVEVMNYWVYKVNSRLFVGSKGWHFDRYFRARRSRPYPMGGRDWIRSPRSWACLKRVRANDSFLCYQSDERKIYGLARAAGPAHESLPGSGVFNSVDFLPGGLRLAVPVPVAHRTTKAVFRNIPAFTVPSRGTIHPVRAEEFRAILAILTHFNPSQQKAIDEFNGRA